MSNDFDVIIAGARAAGAATALLLARAGARVLVIERGAYGSDTLSTHALMRGAVIQLHRWGVLSTIRRAHTPAVRMTTFGYDTANVSVSIEPRYDVDALYAPRRTILDRALVDEATKAGAEFVFRTQVLDLTYSDSRRVNGVAIQTSRGTREVRAELVIGADGLHSLVARRVGAAKVLAGQHRTATLYSYWQGFSAEGYEWRYTSRAASGVIPTNDAVCVFLALPADDLLTAVRPNATVAYERLLRLHSPELGSRLDEARRIEPVRGFGGHVGFLKQSSGPGWALVGDASYFKDPLTAHGITDALRDAELLSRAVVSGTSDAFATFERTRHDLSARLFAITDAIASFDWTEEAVQTLHRQFSSEMSREQKAIAQLESLPCLPSSANALHAISQ